MRSHKATNACDIAECFKKYKKRFDHGNWRSELQNVTIINKDEVIT